MAKKPLLRSQLLVQGLTAAGITLLVSIHSPSPRTFALFDRCGSLSVRYLRIAYKHEEGGAHASRLPRRLVKRAITALLHPSGAYETLSRTSPQRVPKLYHRETPGRWPGSSCVHGQI